MIEDPSFLRFDHGTAAAYTEGYFNDFLNITKDMKS